MSLLSKLNTNTNNKPIEPREIFMTLPSKAPEYGYPRDVQSEVWKKWFELRDEKNVIIKMNTGSGKTVVGLIILQSCLHEGKGPAIFAVPDNYLVKQVLIEAKKLGINATDNRDDYSFLNNKSILVTNIQAIVNGKSVFGMRDYGGNYPIGSIIIDDVHTCMDKINKQFMVKIQSDTELYEKMIRTFQDSILDYDPKGYTDVVELRDCRKELVVPFWVWQRKHKDVYKILKQHCINEYQDVFFGLPLIERCFETCDCIITASEIEISPKGLDIELISSLDMAERRIYMSATLADDSVFVTTLGLGEDDIKNIITPENANDIGDRLILFPKFINSEISDDDVKQQVISIAEDYNVVVLVPSFERARFWDPDRNNTATKENLDKVIENLKKEIHVGLTVIANRYDGIDLPGEACRLLVIDGLPPLNSIKDRYIQSIAPENTLLLREQVQRIEQGMGRGVRSNNDECCVILMGDELSDVLSRNRGIEFFSEATRCQYKLSQDIWELIIEENKNKPSVLEIFDIAKLSLEKDKEWVSMCKSRLANVRYSNSPQIDQTALALRKAFLKGLCKQWREAADIISSVMNFEGDKRTKAFLAQILADYVNMYDPVRSQEILKYGKSLSAGVLTPLDGIEYARKINDIPQASAVQKYVESETAKGNNLIIHIDNILSKLCFNVSYDEFEEAVNSVGVALGFTCSRPDKETGGYGPDNLWAVGNSKYFVIECKNQAKAQTISKDYCNQLSGSMNWFKSMYQQPNVCIPIMIHPTNIVDKKASPNAEMLVIRNEELCKLRENIRGFYSSLNQNNNVNDVNSIGEFLKVFKLRPEDIIKEYLIKFNRCE